MDFKTRLKQLRNYKKLTQKELANIMEVSPSAISMYYSIKRKLYKIKSNKSTINLFTSSVLQR